MHRKLFGVLFTVIIISAFAVVFMPAKDQNVNSKKFVWWDCFENYPKPKPSDEENTAEAADDNLVSKLANKLQNKIINKKTEIESMCTEDYKYKMKAVLTKNRFQKAIGMDMTVSYNPGDNDVRDYYDKIVPYDEQCDYLGGIVDDVDISQNIDKILDFGRYAKEKGINFVYLHTPGKYTSNDVYKDYSAEKDAELLESLKHSNIDYIYFNDYMPKDKNEYANMFYKTDHHWLPQTGIYANKILCSYLNNHYGYNIDTSLFEPDSYRVETSDLPFLGTLGRRVTEVYAEPERFDLYYPKYSTDLKVYDSRYNDYTQGDIKDTLFDYDVLSQKDLYKRLNYVFYGHGDSACYAIHNNNVNDGSRVLMVKTSFADVMYPYLSSVFEDLTVIDLRYFKGSLKSYIEDYKPDTIILVYGITLYGRDDSTDAFDFR